MADWAALRSRILWHGPLLPVLLLAAALRTAFLFPTFLYGDEAEYATVAASLGRDPQDLRYPAIEGFGPTPFVSQPPLLLYVFALAGRLVGSAEAGPILVSALAGIATVAVVYFLGVRLSGRLCGALAALFLAVLPFHVGLSRGGQLDAGFTFLFALSLLLFLRWADTPSRGRALLCGAVAAATAFSKLPGVLVYLPLAVGLVAIAAPSLGAARTGPDGTGHRTRLRRLGAHAALAASPLAAMGAAYLALLWHLRSVGNLLEKLGWQAARVSGARARTGNQHRHWDWYFTDPQVGLAQQLGIVLLVLAALGLALAAVRAVRRDATARILVAWVATVFGFFLASDRKEWFYLMPAVPALVVLAAGAVAAAGRRLRDRMGPLDVPAGEGGGDAGRAEARPRRGSLAAGLAVVVVVAAAVAFPVRATLEERILDRNTYGAGVKEAAIWIHAEDPGAAQAGTTLGRFALHFYNGQDTYHAYLDQGFVADQARSGHLRYVVVDPYLNLTFERAWLAGLVEDHNGTLAQEFRVPDGRSVLVYRLG